MTNKTTMTECSQVGLDIAQRTMASAMNSHVGQGRAWSVEGLSQTTGIPVSSLKAYRAGEQTPGLHYFLRLSSALGPEFTNQVLAPIGIGGAHWLDNDEVHSLGLSAKASGLAAMICEHAEDGRIDHRELLEQVPAVRYLHTECGAFLAKHEKKAA